jgi:threonine dehydrogenase-like Zn-dependent dehydrogenase
MKALLFERQLARFAAARVVAVVAGSGRGVSVGPLRLAEIDKPELPGDGWWRVRPRLAGICGSDLATLDAASSRYFEQIVSFPFVPGHEVVGDVEGGPLDGKRVVIEPVLGCVARGIDPPCAACAGGHKGRCERIAFGHLKAGLQTGYCADTGGGWSAGLVAHESQLHVVPDELSDEAAVMVEPAACAIHAALSAGPALPGARVVVLGAGTVGLLVVAALRQFALPASILSIAKHPHQRRLASDLGADVVAEPDELLRAVRRQTGTLALSRHGSAGEIERLAGGADVVFDCVGSAQSLSECLAVTRPGGRIVLVGMPGVVRVDLAPLWQREIVLAGAYAYGTETRPEGERSTFDLAFELVAAADLGRLVSGHYPLECYEDALEQAGNAGRRGAVKVVFDVRRVAPRPLGGATVPRRLARDGPAGQQPHTGASDSPSNSPSNNPTDSRRDRDGARDTGGAST